MAQVVGIGDHLHPLARIRRSARRSARTRPRTVVQHARRVRVERTVHGGRAVHEPVEGRRFPYGIDEHLHRRLLVAARRQRPSTSERRKAPILSEEARHHCVLIAQADLAFGKRRHEPRARRYRTVVVLDCRLLLRRANEPDGVRRARSAHDLVGKAFGHAATRSMKGDAHVLASLGAQLDAHVVRQRPVDHFRHLQTQLVRRKGVDVRERFGRLHIEDRPARRIRRQRVAGARILEASERLVRFPSERRLHERPRRRLARKLSLTFVARARRRVLARPRHDVDASDSRRSVECSSSPRCSA